MDFTFTTPSDQHDLEVFYRSPRRRQGVPQDSRHWSGSRRTGVGDISGPVALGLSYHASETLAI